MIIGDWNANIGQNGNSLFGPIMMDFCEENNLIVSTKELLPSSTYSHITNRMGNMYKTWIDHIVSSNDTHMAIEHIDMLYNTTDEDHIPFTIHLNVSSIPKVTSETNNVVSRINWNNIKDSEIQKYYKNTKELLGKVRIPSEAINCQNMKCISGQHKQDLNTFYSEITDILQNASSHLNVDRAKNYTPRPGWTEYVSELYDYSKTCHQAWLDANVPRQGRIHENYVKSRARFKYALKVITKN